jgi:hypothetical protein
MPWRTGGAHRWGRKTATVPVLVDQLEHSTIVCALPSLHRFGAHPRPAPVLPRPFPLPSPTTARTLIRPSAARRHVARAPRWPAQSRRALPVQMAATCSEQHAIAYTAEAVRFRSVGVLKATPILSDLIRSDPIRSDPILSDPIRSYPIRSDLIRSYPIQSGPALDGRSSTGFQVKRALALAHARTCAHCGSCELQSSPGCREMPH